MLHDIFVFCCYRIQNNLLPLLRKNMIDTFLGGYYEMPMKTIAIVLFLKGNWIHSVRPVQDFLGIRFTVSTWRHPFWATSLKDVLFFNLLLSYSLLILRLLFLSFYYLLNFLHFFPIHLSLPFLLYFYFFCLHWSVHIIHRFFCSFASSHGSSLLLSFHSLSGRFPHLALLADFSLCVRPLFSPFLVSPFLFSPPMF